MAEKNTSETIWIFPSQLSILENAESLLKDAELLYEQKRHARALSLAILAFEEVGKVYLIGLEGAAAQSELKGPQHVKRQQLAQGLLMAGPVLKELSNILEEWKLPNDPHATTAFLFAVVKAKHRATTEEDRVAFEQLEETLLKEIVERLKGKEVAQIAKEINSRQANKTKQAGFYCDVDPTGKLISDPSQITPEQARSWLDRASYAVYFCASNKPDQIPDQ